MNGERPTQLNFTRWNLNSVQHSQTQRNSKPCWKKFWRSKLSRDRRWYEGAKVWIFRLAKAHNKTMLSQPQIKTCRMQRPALFNGHIMSSVQIRSAYIIISLLFWRIIIFIWFTVRTVRESSPKTKNDHDHGYLFLIFLPKYHSYQYS